MGITCERESIKEKRERTIKNLEAALQIAIEGNPYIIKQLKKHNLGIDYSKYEKNIVDIINGPTREMDAIQFYDVIVSIQSIKDINKGWNVRFSERFERDYKNFVNEKILKIGVIGNSNKGKSFILSKLSKIELPSGTSIKTEGLSIKYPDCKIYKNRKIVLLDSAGLETPVIRGDNEYSIMNNIKIEKNEKINKKENIMIIKENENKNEIAHIQNGNTDKREQSENELFKEKSREKILTELFLQNYIIHNSDILIVVVGLLTYSEQKILNRIKTELKRAKLNRTLYVIHNLMTFTAINQVESYIDEILLKIATFELEKQIKINLDTISQSDYGVCFNEKNTSPSIFHLIFANEGSSAGDYYNKYTLQFLIHSFEKNTGLKEFDIIKTVKNRFIEVSKDFFENLQGNIKFEDSKKIIKLVEPKEIKLKQCFIDELGFSNVRASGFEPHYNYYKNKNQIIVRVEAPGNCNIKSSIENSGEYKIIKLRGNKEKDMEPEKIEDNIFNGRELGQFSLDIPLNAKEFPIKDGDPLIGKKNGIFILIYELQQKRPDVVFTQQQNERV